MTTQQLIQPRTGNRILATVASLAVVAGLLFKPTPAQADSGETAAALLIGATLLYAAHESRDDRKHVRHVHVEKHHVHSRHCGHVRDPYRHGWKEGHGWRAHKYHGQKHYSHKYQYDRNYHRYGKHPHRDWHGGHHRYDRHDRYSNHHKHRYDRHDYRNRDDHRGNSHSSKEHHKRDHHKKEHRERHARTMNYF